MLNINKIISHDLYRFLFSVINRKSFLNLMERRSSDNLCDISYKQFDENKAIFVHIPKCAGISIAKGLFGSLCGAHTDVKYYKIIFTKKEFESYFKFTFVRNPWDRLYSAYHFLKKGGINENDKVWADNNIAHYECFNDFINNWVTRENVYKYLHFRPQYSFICNSNLDVLVDYLGYFENIHNDYSYIASKLEKQTTLPYENKGGELKNSYINAYTEETKSIVANTYKEDIELFGYEFNNSNIQELIKKRDKRGE